MNSHASTKELSFFTLFEKFISDSARGKRVQPNGKRISAGTVKNYEYTLRLLRDFSSEKKFSLRIRPQRYLDRKQTEVERNYWKKFYRRFTDYLYNNCGHYDNYVGQTIKNVKLFFNYLNKERSVGTGDFHKLFYVRKEEIAIFPLMPEELNYLIYNKDFEDSLTTRMRQVKDFFAFGCTVALRVSDLLKLNRSNLRILNDQYYLSVRSIKTSTDSLIKLPAYAVNIILKYGKQKRLLPHFNKSNLNKYIKQLLALAGLTHPVQQMREKRGFSVERRNDGRVSATGTRFCDIASTHTMRRTAITTMLCLGMPEQIVRRISGHAPGSKEFYRYVLWAQTYQDSETEKMFEKLRQKGIKAA